MIKFKHILKNNSSLILISCIYLLTRLVNLTLMPIFTDESIYLYWAKFIQTNLSHWFLPITDGKPPLFVWMISILLAIFPESQYLLAGRIVAVFIGLVCLWGIYKLSSEIFHSRLISTFSSLFYIIAPYTYFYDRMVLFDTPLSAALVWSVYLSRKLARQTDLKNSILLGLSLGIAFYFKPTALIFWFMIPVVTLLWKLESSGPKTFTVLKNLIFMLAISLTLSQLINQTMRLSSAYPAFVAKNAQFAHPLSEIITSPTRHLSGNLPTLIRWTGEWLTYPFFYFCLAGIIVLLWLQPFTAAALGLLVASPVLGLAVFGREIFPRYLLFLAPYLYISAAYLFHKLIRSKHIIIGLFGIICATVFSLNLISATYVIASDPINSKIPDADFEQYISGHPSGYGLERVFEFIDSHPKPITIVTEGTFGLYPYAFNLRYWHDQSVSIVARFPMKFDQQIFDISLNQPVYIVLKDHDSIPADYPLDLIETVAKPAGGRPPIILTVYNRNNADDFRN